MKPARKKFAPSVYAGIIASQKGLCGCGCGEPLGDDPRDIQFDHVLDLQWGGSDTPDNLKALKSRHHLIKTTKAAKERAKVARIQKRDGMHKRKMNGADQALAKILEGVKP
jgi:5-methylcytosine-specific restriction endonuclease McrA